MSREGGARERSQNIHRYVEDTGESLKFLVIYVLLPMTVMLVSCGCPGFKLVMVLLLTFGSKSKLLQFRLSIRCCHQLQINPALFTLPYSLARIYWLRLVCVNILLGVGQS